MDRPININILSGQDDMYWLRDTHHVDIYTPSARRAEVAVIHGNEDCPEKVELFTSNHVKAKPFRVYVLDEDTGVLEIV